MPTLINVCGASHSGTTMIDLMLGNASDAFSCGEVYAWFRPYRTHHFEIVCPCGKNPCPYWGKIKHFSENIFHQQVFKQLKMNFVIDSSKDICWVIDTNYWASKNRINVVNLLVWKNPIYLAYSYWKRGWDISASRGGFVRYYTRFFEVKLPFFSVSYNELVQNPGNKLKEICEAIGIEYFEGKERFWEKQHHHLFGSLGTRKQIGKKDPRIRASENFPSEFLKEVEWFSQTIENDTEVQTILQILKTSEVSVKDLVRVNEQNASPPRVRPIWYYKDWLKRIYKRHFPEPWPPDMR